jgi:hypothetical protein
VDLCRHISDSCKNSTSVPNLSFDTTGTLRLNGLHTGNELQSNSEFVYILYMCVFISIHNIHLYICRIKVTTECMIKNKLFVNKYISESALKFEDGCEIEVNENGSRTQVRA